MIGQNPKAEVAPFFVDENRDNEISFRTAVGVTRCVNTVVKIPGEEAERIWDKKN